MGLKVCCTQGGIIEGTPGGKFEEIAGIKTYIASAEGGDASKAIIVFTDAFGLGLKNNLLIADMLSKETGITVYVPDLFEGTPASWHVMGPALSVKAQREEKAQTWFYQRWFKLLKIAAEFVPFLVRHHPSKKAKAELVDRIVKAVPATSIGVSGYCYGAKCIDHLAKTGTTKVKSIFVAHPSFLSPSQILAWNYPTSVACPEVDIQMKKSAQEELEAGLRRKEPMPTEFIRYPDTQHGFAARPHWPDQADDFHKALQQSIDWHKRFVV